MMANVYVLEWILEEDVGCMFSVNDVIIIGIAIGIVIGIVIAVIIG